MSESKKDENAQSNLSAEAQTAIDRALSLLKENGIPILSASWLHDDLFPTLTVSHEDQSDPAGGYVTEEPLGNRPYLLIGLDIDAPAVGFIPYLKTP